MVTDQWWESCMRSDGMAWHDDRVVDRCKAGTERVCEFEECIFILTG